MPEPDHLRNCFRGLDFWDRLAIESADWDMHLTPHPLYIVVRIIRF